MVCQCVIAMVLVQCRPVDRLFQQGIEFHRCPTDCTHFLSTGTKLSHNGAAILYVHFIQKYTWLVLTLHIWISNNFRLQKYCILYVSLTTIGFFRCYIYSHWHSQNNNLSLIMNMGHRLRVCLCFCFVFLLCFFLHENHNNKIIVYKPKHVCFSTLPKLLWE